MYNKQGHSATSICTRFLVQGFLKNIIVGHMQGLTAGWAGTKPELFKTEMQWARDRGSRPEEPEEAWKESSGPDKAVGWIWKCPESGKHERSWCQELGRSQETSGSWGEGWVLLGERVRNKAAGTSIMDVLKPRQLPLPRGLLCTSCQDEMLHVGQCAQACRWEQGEEADMVQWPGWSYSQGKVLAFSLSLWEGNLSRSLFLDLMQYRRTRVFAETPLQLWGLWLEEPQLSTLGTRGEVDNVCMRGVQDGLHPGSDHHTKEQGSIFYFKS